MCSSAPKVDNSAQVQAQEDAARSRADEEARQARTRQGIERINRLFDAGETLTTTQTQAETPEWQAWNQRRQAALAAPASPAQGGAGGYFETLGPGTEGGGENVAWRPDGGPAVGDVNAGYWMNGGDGQQEWVWFGGQRGGQGGGQGGGYGGMFDEPEPERYRTTTSENWNKTGPAFDDAYFARRRQEYLDLYTPEVGKQYSDAQNQLAFALARAGLSRSTVADDRVGRLQGDYALQTQRLAADAEGEVSRVRNAVEDARSGLIAQVQATGDADTAASAALSRAGVIAQDPIKYSPLTDLFGTAASGIGNYIAAQNRAELNAAITGASSARGRGNYSTVK